jgi:hypothetical protein
MKKAKNKKKKYEPKLAIKGTLDEVLKVAVTPKEELNKGKK